MTAVDDFDQLTRTPPASLPLEENIAGSVLASPETLDAVVAAGLTVGDFYHPHTTAVWRAVLELAVRGEPYDAASVHQLMLSSGALRVLPDNAWLITAQFAANPAAAVYHAGKVRDLAAKRRAIVAGSKILQAGWAAESTAADVQALAETEVSRIGAPVDETKWSTVEDVMWSVYDRYEQTRDSGGMSGVTWGYKDVDSLMAPLQPGDLAVIVAWAGGGKSVVAANLALHAAVDQGIPSVVHALEMTRIEIGQRYAAATGGIHLERILAGKLTPTEEDHFAGAIEKLKGTPLIIDETERVNLSRVRASIRKHNPQLVIIDQIPIMVIDDEKPSREQQLTRLTYDLHELAKMEKVAIVACAQLNSAPMGRGDKVPTLQDIRESRGIGQAASIVVFLHDPTGGNREDPRVGEIEWWVRKQRMGRKDECVVLAQQFHHSRLADLYRDDR